MHEIHISNVNQWHNDKSIRSPLNFSHNCPNCNSYVSFTVSNHRSYLTQFATMATATCPSCLVESLIVCCGKDSDEGKYPATIALYPHPRTRTPVDGYNILPEKVSKAYISAVNAYNYQLWSNVAVSCRRTLEGVINSLPGMQSNKTLYAALQELGKSHTGVLAGPLIKLAELLRSGGNLGAHFDEDLEPDEDMATALLDLLDYLITYLHVLPGKLTELENRIQQLATPGS